MIIPFASVDPARPDAVERVRGARRRAARRGSSSIRTSRRSSRTTARVYPLYEAIAEAGVPALFHSGHSGIGTGVPGGGGLRLKYSNPMCLDDVAADFPALQIVLAHPSFPWQDEAISICLHKENVWIDLSGWSPKYFPPQLVQYANTQLRTKVLFGSDFPLITPERWLADFAAAPFKDEVRPLVLKENATRLLGLVVIETVRGSVAPEALGRTLPHEHVFILGQETLANFNHRWGKPWWDEEARVADAVGEAPARPRRRGSRRSSTRPPSASAATSRGSSASTSRST